MASNPNEETEPQASWYKTLRRHPWVLSAIAITAILGGVASFSENLGSVGDKIYASWEAVDDWYRKRGLQETLAEADRLYFEQDKRERARGLYEVAADLNDPYAVASLAKLYHNGWAGAAKDTHRAAAMVLSVLETLQEKSQHHPRYAYALGYLYSSGIGVAKNQERAVELYRSAANEGYAAAQYNLASLSWVGEGMPKNEEMAFNLHLSAANQGHLSAMSWVGRAYRFGWGVEASSADAVEWLRRASSSGSGVAAYHLGRMYADSSLEYYDLVAATKYYALAHELGEVLGTERFAHALYYAKGVPEDKDEAVELWRRAADAGSSNAAANLWSAFFYSERSDERIREDEAIRYLKKAAEEKNSYALKKLSYVLRVGAGVPVDLVESFMIAKLCLENGNMSCHFDVAFHYGEGLGTEKNTDLAIHHYRHAMENGSLAGARNLAASLKKKHGTDDPEMNRERLKILNDVANKDSADSASLYAIGKIYRSNVPGIPEDQWKASEYILRAAELGSVDAANDIGWRYYKGIGVTEDLEKAVEWLKLGLAKGSALASANLLHILEQERPPGLEIEEIENLRQDGLIWHEEEYSDNFCILNTLANRYERGYQAKRDLDKAIYLYEKAAKLGSLAAKYNLSRLTLSGDSVRLSVNDALELLYEAVRAESPHANLLMAKLYLEGRFREPDRQKAVFYFASAVNFGLDLDSDVAGEELPEEWIAVYKPAPMSCSGELLNVKGLLD
ncbi:MAG: hypothetical protein AAF098_18950 [Pseudomonadota bacterium]